MERLTEEKIEVLRQWGEGLAHDEREETRAAGRAILLLVEEIDQLNVDLWNQRAGHAPIVAAEEPEEALDDVPSSLRARLRQLGRRRSQPAEIAPPEAST